MTKNEAGWKKLIARHKLKASGRSLKRAGSASWRDNLKEASNRRDFPNLMFAEKWIRSLSKAGMYPRWWGDDKGE